MSMSESVRLVKSQTFNLDEFGLKTVRIERMSLLSYNQFDGKNKTELWSYNSQLTEVFWVPASLKLV